MSLTNGHCACTHGQDGTTALMAASVRGHKAAVDALVKHGANVDQQNLDGHTALMFAYNGRNQVTSHQMEGIYLFCTVYLWGQPSCHLHCQSA